MRCRPHTPRINTGPPDLPQTFWFLGRSLLVSQLNSSFKVRLRSSTFAELLLPISQLTSSAPGLAHSSSTPVVHRCSHCFTSDACAAHTFWQDARCLQPVGGDTVTHFRTWVNLSHGEGSFNVTPVCLLIILSTAFSS